MKTITLIIPSFTETALFTKSANFYRTIVQAVSSFHFSAVDYASYGVDTTSSPASSTPSRFTLRNLKRFFKKSPMLPVGILALVILFIVVITIRSVNNANGTNVLSQTSSVNKVNDSKVRAGQELNKSFSFPLKDNNGKEVSRIKYVIENATLQDEIIVKGQRATTVKGRTFLILNLKITNDYNRSIQMNMRDYIRLVVNKSSEKLAPEIHNDPVEVQGISTKYTRVAFPINAATTDLQLQVGELNGVKETIVLDLR